MYTVIIQYIYISGSFQHINKSHFSPATALELTGAHGDQALFVIAELPKPSKAVQ